MIVKNIIEEKNAKLKRAYEYFVDDIVDFTKFHHKRSYYEENVLHNKFVEMKFVYLLLKKDIILNGQFLKF